MNLSDDSDDSISNNGNQPQKRRRMSSATSPDSDAQESDEEQSRVIASKRRKMTIEQDIRLSRSSQSENCSDHDDYRPEFGEQDVETPSQDISYYQESGERYYDKQSDEVEKKNKTGDYSNNAYFQDFGERFYNKKSDEDEIDKSDAKIGGDYSNFSKKYMSKMGYTPGKGLGKFEHGRAEPVEASNQKGRRGLGLKPSTLGELPRDFKYVPDAKEPEAKEIVEWMHSSPSSPLSGDLLDEWLVKGTKKLTIDDETNFIDPNILGGILKTKTVFDSLDDEDLRNSRFRSNPYETIGAVMFLNRAAVKMANIDAICDFMFTKPLKQNGDNLVDYNNEVLYFADVCAGPGGFSEYILFRRGWKAKGFGFTLKGQNDFKLSNFYAGTPETFNPYYGVEDNGDIFNPENLSSLKDKVLEHTDDKGVHFLMADGGFSVEGQENIQEILSKQLYLCQCLAALMLVRTGGHFVVKLFDIFTPFSVGLIYIMYRCFEKVCIHKPVTSRPANSERYLICKWKRLGTEASENHLFNVNCILSKQRERDIDVTHLVPLSVLQEDTDFFEYIYKSNCLIGENQIQNLLKIAHFSEDKSLKENSQAKIREECLKLWQLPNKMRTQPEKFKPDDALSNILSSISKKPPDIHNLHAFKTNTMGKEPVFLKTAKDLKMFKSVYDWHFMFLNYGSNPTDLKLFLGCGGKEVYQLDGVRWRNVSDLHLTLPPKTLIYGEVVKELRGEGSKQFHTKTLHVIDAVILGGRDVSCFPLSERLNQCALFCIALDKPFNNQAIPLRCKRLFNMENFSNAINNLEIRSTKNIRRAVTVKVPNRSHNTETFHVVGSILFIKEIKEPWESKMSRGSGHKYYFKAGTKQPSEYKILPEAVMDSFSTYTSRVMWLWESAGAILENLPHEGLTRSEMEEFIESSCNK